MYPMATIMYGTRSENVRSEDIFTRIYGLLWDAVTDERGGAELGEYG